MITNNILDFNNSIEEFLCEDKTSTWIVTKENLGSNSSVLDKEDGLFTKQNIKTSSYEKIDTNESKRYRISITEARNRALKALNR